MDATVSEIIELNLCPKRYKISKDVETETISTYVGTQIHDMIMEFLTTGFGKIPPHIQEPIEGLLFGWNWLVEQDVSTTRYGVHVRGRIDVVATQGDKVMLIDWKTGLSHNLLRNELQIGLYGLLYSDMNHITPENLSLVVINVRTGRIHKYTQDTFIKTQDLLMKADEAIKKYYSIVENGHFKPKLNPYCNTCPFVFDCVAKSFGYGSIESTVMNYILADLAKEKAKEMLKNFDETLFPYQKEINGYNVNIDFKSGRLVVEYEKSKV